MSNDPLGDAPHDGVREPAAPVRPDHDQIIALGFGDLDDGARRHTGLAPHFASPGVPMDAYGEACREHYRAEGPVRSNG